MLHNVPLYLKSIISYYFLFSQTLDVYPQTLLV